MSRSPGRRHGLWPMGGVHRWRNQDGHQWWHEGRADHGHARLTDESLLLQKVVLLLLQPLPLPPPQSWIGVHVDGPSPRVVEGRLGARGLAALALVALARSAAATPTTTTALFLTLTTIARGTRLSRRRRSWGVVGVECLRGSHRRVGAERDLI
jgi:hypothetical protein